MTELDIIVIMSGIGILLTLFFFLKYLIEAIFSYRWPKVEGIIESSYCKSLGGEVSIFYYSRGGEGSYRPAITYSYCVDGKEYQSDRVKIGYQRFGGTEGWAQQTVDKYPIDKKITVFYNPKSPEKAVLEVGLNLRVILFPFAGLFVILMILFVIIVANSLLRWVTSLLGTREEGIFYNVFIPIFGIGGLIAFFFFIKSILTVRTSNSWPSVEGEIVSSEIGKKIDGFSEPYTEPVILYSYNVGGRDYQAKRVVIGQWSHSGNEEWSRKKIVKYPPRKRVKVYYNPNSPRTAVLEPGMNSQFVWLWGGIFFMIFIISLFITFFLSSFVLP